MYIYSWKKLIKFWPILVILYVKVDFVLSHVVFNLTMEWTPVTYAQFWYIIFQVA